MEVTVGINGRDGDWSEDDEAAHNLVQEHLVDNQGGVGEGGN